MNEPINNDSPHRQSAWVAPIVLIALHGLFDIIFSPFQEPPNYWPSMLAAGVLYVQPLLFGVWAALGTGFALLRIPISWISFASINIFAFTIHRVFGQSGFKSTQLLMILCVTCIGTTIVLLIVRKVTRWRIDNLPLGLIAGNETGQFSLKFLLGLTTACAILLGAGRGLANSRTLEGTETAEILKVTGFLLMLMFPAVIALLATLSPKLSKRVWIAIPPLWILLSVLDIGAYQQIENNSNSWKQACDILLIQGGALIAALASALFLRFCGFRLVRRMSKQPASSAPSP